MHARKEHAGRQALAQRLGELREGLQEKRQTDKAVIEEVNRRRRKAAGLREDEPCRRPYKEGGDLGSSTVNGWFPKQKAGSKEPTVPQHFDELWSVVVVMLELISGRDTRYVEGRYRLGWAQLHEDAQRWIGMDEEVRGYLEAARKAAEEHPYPEIPEPPSLTEVYVRQRSHPADRDGRAVPGDGSAGGRSSTGPAASSEPAEAVFRAADRVSVLIAAPVPASPRCCVRGCATRPVNCSTTRATPGSPVRPSRYG